MPRISVTTRVLPTDGTGPDRILMKCWRRDRGMSFEAGVELSPEAAALLVGRDSTPKPLDEIDGHEPIDEDELRLRFPRGPVAGWRYETEVPEEFGGGGQVYGSFSLYPDGLLTAATTTGRTWFHSRHPGASSDEVAAWLLDHGYELWGADGYIRRTETGVEATGRL